MVAPRIDSLNTAVERIVDCLHPDRIVLFGSRARGDARADSDIDLLVIADTPQPRHQRAVNLYRGLADLPAEFDIVVYTPAEIAEWQEVTQSLPATAMREGSTLYEKPR